MKFLHELGELLYGNFVLHIFGELQVGLCVTLKFGRFFSRPIVALSIEMSRICQNFSFGFVQIESFTNMDAPATKKRRALTDVSNVRFLRSSLFLITFEANNTCHINLVNSRELIFFYISI